MQYGYTIGVLTSDLSHSCIYDAYNYMYIYFLLLTFIIMRLQNIIFVLAVLVLSGSLIYIGNQLEKWASRVENTISVSGEGESSIAPDSMVISLSVSELGTTTEQAQIANNTKMEQVQNILKKYAVAEKNIKTENVSVYEEYDWTDNGRKPLGYRATQSLTITLDEWDYTDIWAKIIDAVATIGGVQVNNTYFALQDKNEAMAAAREAAFADARAKADQLAKAAWLRVKKALSITDSYVDYGWPIYPMYAKAEMAMDGAESVPTANISAGEMDVKVQIQVVFEMK